MQAVILAGGRGIRLKPVTDKIPKPMVDINGKPFLYHQINLLKKHNITNVLLCVGYLGKQIKNFFGNGEKMEVNLKYSFEKGFLGTGGAIKNASKHLDDWFMVLYGDSYLPINYQKLIEFHKSKNKKAVLVVYGNEENTDVKNNVRIGDSDNVVIYDKSGNQKNLGYVDAGASIFEKSDLSLIPDNAKVSLENDLFPKLIKVKKLIAYKTKKRFYDMGTIERLNLLRGILK